MAGITIKGDTSGEITLNVPATAGANTITIPASSGTLAVQDGSGDLAVTNDLSVGGNISTPSGTVTASSFSGDGSSLTGIAGGFSNMEVFTSPGTWTNPGSVQKVKVTVVGGGGSSSTITSPANVASACGGGGGGGTAIEVIPFPSGTDVPVTVGGAAGTSSFGAYCSATGGSTATTVSTSYYAIASGANGGSGSGGTLNISGSVGGFTRAGNQGFEVGSGGGSTLGQGAQVQTYTEASGVKAVPSSGNGYGSGASGGYVASGAPTQPGASGAPGVVVVEY